ncbi:alpha/beta-type small acid-soluble spore protein [Cohnella fermenti]|uniref:Alpha/beta-type small acid-soluble spore protein n=1 Tax=Cohnella fermenti TaxID=2565925 RepID=A0A4S4C8D0_9BACL|nr:alpha/beta-type small acid-soluble spore protein [Cohnella fermenti]THF84275.1 alpha/beta-type small acid-soluble spore protein [Cohnella fermenti]
MSRRGNRRPVVDGAEQALRTLKADVMRREGFAVDPSRPDDVKYEVAESLGVPLTQGDNGKLTTEAVGHVGGRIGGSMVREMIRMAQEKLSREQGES